MISRQRRQPARQRAPLTRTQFVRSPSRVGAKAARRRQDGGKLAVGRDSGTREELLRERAYVFDRAAGRCELCRLLPDYDGHKPTDFAHIRSRGQGGDNSRFNALATCHTANQRMAGGNIPFSRGRWLVVIVIVNSVRGFDAELVQAVSKFAYRDGQYKTLGAGFIAALHATDEAARRLADATA